MKVYGTISRRVLVNYRADPSIVQKIIPGNFELDLFNGYAMVGICFLSIKNANVLPMNIGVKSDNAAHRIAVICNGRHGVYIPRRDTGSYMNSIIGGRLFPGEHHYSKFLIKDDGINIQINIDNNHVRVASIDATAGGFMRESIFGSINSASEFYKCSSMGYSKSLDGKRLDGLELITKSWITEGAIVKTSSSYLYDDANIFPPGSIEIDNVLVMRNIVHHWNPLTQLSVTL